MHSPFGSPSEPKNEAIGALISPTTPAHGITDFIINVLQESALP